MGTHEWSVDACGKQGTTHADDICGKQGAKHADTCGKQGKKHVRPTPVANETKHMRRQL
jgi:hypothetical protein